VSDHLKFIATHPPFRVNNYSRLDLIRRELRSIIAREGADPYADPRLENMLEEVLDLMDSYLDWEPSDEDILGEPPMTADEMHSAAWAEHQAAHS
jgi:hypothetical protein